MEKLVIGIDISAKTLDICNKRSDNYVFEIVENESKAIKLFFKKVQKIEPNAIVSMENTGRITGIFMRSWRLSILRFLYSILCI